MFGTALRQGSAATRYARVDIDSRVEGANPHELVVILFDELVKALDGLVLAIRNGDVPRRLERQARAVSILHGLDTALDFERGGEIAVSLSQIYREARRLIMDRGDRWLANAEQARAMIADIAGAWSAIGGAALTPR